MQTIGERLEDARKKKGISIREAAEATKIRGDYLQKFESNHFDLGLTEIYTKGFLRSYANFLKLPADRILSDYAALGRGEVRPRQPSREIYGRMDISVSSAGEPSERAAPPDELPPDDAPPARAQTPRYPRSSGTALPSGPDPAVVFQWAKWIGLGVLVIVVVLIGRSLLTPTPKPRETPAPAATTAPAQAAPAAAAPTSVSDRVVTITALNMVVVQVWEKLPNAPTPAQSYGRELLPQTTLRRGESRTVPKTGPLYINASAQENIQIETGGRTFSPADYGHRGNTTIELK
jgi:transcriptional regulator with XRE-family HTH domain